jgi:hypothetical protein
MPRARVRSAHLRAVALSLVLGMVTTLVVALTFAFIGPSETNHPVSRSARRSLQGSEGSGFLSFGAVRSVGYGWTGSQVARHVLFGPGPSVATTPERLSNRWPSAFRLPWPSRRPWPQQSEAVVVCGVGWPFLALQKSALNEYDAGKPGSLHFSGMQLPATWGDRFPSLVLYGTPLLPVNPVWPGLCADVIVFTGAWSALLIGLPEWRRARRSRMGRCPACGYDVRGAPGPCPECAWTAERRVP